MLIIKGAFNILGFGTREYEPHATTRRGDHRACRLSPRSNGDVRCRTSGTQLRKGLCSLM